MKRTLYTAILAGLLACGWFTTSCTIEPKITIPTDTIPVKVVFADDLPALEVLAEKLDWDMCPNYPDFVQYARQVQALMDQDYDVWRIAYDSADPECVNVVAFMRRRADKRVRKLHGRHVAYLCD